MRYRADGAPVGGLATNHGPRFGFAAAALLFAVAGVVGFLSGFGG
jgi:hypothetical protein